MKTEKWIVLSILLLSLSIAFSGFFIGKSVLSLAESKKQAVIEPSKQVNIESKCNEDILSFSEAAVYLKVSEEKLKFLVSNSYLKDGEGIPYYKIDDNTLFSKTALSKWIVHISENQFDY